MIVQLVEGALTDLGLHMDRQKLMLTLQNIGGETLTQEQFRMVIGSQHIMDENTAKNLMNKASESRKLEQRARAKLLHIKGNEQRVVHDVNLGQEHRVIVNRHSEQSFCLFGQV